MLAERALMESELADLVEGEFAYPVTIKGGPDGLTYTGQGFVQYDARRESSEGLGAVIVQECAVTLRMSQWPDWMFTVPFNTYELICPANPNGPMVSRLVDGAKASEPNRTLGIVRIYPKRAAQK